MGGEAWVAHPRDGRVRLEEARDGERVLAVALDAQVQRLQALQEEKRVEGRQRRTEVAQEDDAQAHGERRGAERLREREAVVRGLRIREEGLEARVLPPVEVSAVHDRAADGGAVAADPLRGRMEDDVCSVLDRPAE